MVHRKLLTTAVTAASATALLLSGTTASAGEARGSFHQTNLVSDIPGMAAHFDPNLVNPWGIATGATPIWVADNNGNVSTIYDGAGNTVRPPVVIPAPASPTGGAPTGTVFNGSTDFNGDLFLFATEDGTIVGWRRSDGNQARIEVDRSTVGSGAVYKGLAIGNNGSGNHLYATNFRFGTVEVFDAAFHLVSLAGGFNDPAIPAGFAPFNVQNLGGRLYVTYARQKPDKHDDLAGPGNGFVDVYDLNGNLIKRLVRRGELNSPWGLAIAPEDFGPFAGSLLVGNFGDGHINAYSPRSGHFRGELRSEKGGAIVIPGLWGLRFGNGLFGASVDTLYFTAGINDEADGLFGSLVAVRQDD